jgi:hypothetical protein
MPSIFTTDRIKEASSIGLRPGEWPDLITIDGLVCEQGDHFTRGHDLDLIYVKYHAISDRSKVFRVIND